MVCKDLDLFKADIFSLGVVLAYAATGHKGFKIINTGKVNDEIFYKVIHGVNLPVQLKQIMLHMTQYSSTDRIPTVSLFNNLKDIMR
jgi:hypothetical protein